MCISVSVYVSGAFFPWLYFFLFVLSYYSVFAFTLSYFIISVYPDGIGKKGVRIWVDGEVVIWEALGRGIP